LRRFLLIIFALACGAASAWLEEKNGIIMTIMPTRPDKP